MYDGESEGDLDICILILPGQPIFAAQERRAKCSMFYMLYGSRDWRGTSDPRRIAF